MTNQQATIAVPETAEDLVIRNLIETLNRVHADLERIELWTAALACFQETVPQYQPSTDHLLAPTARAFALIAKKPVPFIESESFAKARCFRAISCRCGAFP